MYVPDSNLNSNKASVPVLSSRSDSNFGSSSEQRYQNLIFLFNRCFKQDRNTVLIKGKDEPIYLPAGFCHDNAGLDADESKVSEHHRVVFAHGYFSSALHEIAHWCIAGKERRKQVDFGYWYEPDGRTAEQQTQFESVEIKPQALEWIFSVAAAHLFRVSLDNLNGVTTDNNNFKQAVYQQVLIYCQQGLPERANRFRMALVEHFHTEPSLQADQFFPEELT